MVALVGVQSADFLAIFKSAKGTKALLSGNFTIGVDASATAGPVGTGRGAATTCADAMFELRSVIACVGPYCWINWFTIDIGTWLTFMFPDCRCVPELAW